MADSDIQGVGLGLRPPHYAPTVSKVVRSV